MASADRLYSPFPFVLDSMPSMTDSIRHFVSIPCRNKLRITYNAINRKIRLEKVEVEHISSYIMLVQNIMAKEKIDIIELGKYSVCSNIDDLISKYSTADVPSSETILKWFKMYYKKTIATV